MRILLLNPNTTTALTDRLATAARTVAGPETTLIPLTAERGMPYISSRAEAQIAGAIALEMLASHDEGVDGAIIAAFGDPGLFAARELFDFPVVGMAEAAMLTACMVGGKFAIVTFATAMHAWYQECVEAHGLANRCAGIKTLSGGFKSIADVQEEKEDLLVELAMTTLAELPADVLILGGAPLAGLASKVQARIPVPLIDPVQAALKQVETLVTLKVAKASVGSFRRPSPKDSIGLAESLAQRIRHADG